jgi:hypothetical protein
MTYLNDFNVFSTYWSWIIDHIDIQYQKINFFNRFTSSVSHWRGVTFYSPGRRSFVAQTSIRASNAMEKSIAAETLASYENFSERDSRIDRMRGQEDGEQNYPSRDALSFSTYEQTKIADARSAINQYTRRMRQSIDRLSMEIRDKKLQRDEDYGSRKRALNDDLTAQLKRQNTLIGIESQEHAELSEKPYLLPESRRGLNKDVGSL